MKKVKRRNHITGPSIVAQTYHDYDKLLHRFAWRFKTRYGGEYDDWYGEAQVAFVDAYSTYNHTSTKSFSTWLWHSCNYRLREAVRAKMRAENLHELPVEELHSMHHHRHTLHQQVEAHAKECTKELFHLLIDPPAHMTKHLQHPNPEIVWDCIQQYLIHHLRWQHDIITTALNELRELCFED